jgi:outer membrane murein-binding lipoprotein Lpp
MKRFMQGAIVAIVLFTSGCCTTRDKVNSVSVDDYRAAIEQIKSNLETNIKPAVVEVMATSDKSDEWKQAKLELIDDTITLATDTLAGKNAGKTEDKK